jgi:hypothetical protein
MKGLLSLRLRQITREKFLCWNRMEFRSKWRRAFAASKRAYELHEISEFVA